MMLSKTQSKYIRSLALQKFRKEHNSFLIEGEKIVGEWLASKRPIELIAGTIEWLSNNQEACAHHPECLITEVNEVVLQQISCLHTPNKVIAVVPQQKNTLPDEVNKWCIALEAIRDPGNMGTILRIADWFGIEYVVYSNDCVDVYNPKVVQAAMGAHLRVKLIETDLLNFIQHSVLPSFAATLDGINIYNCPKAQEGILLIGNESKGLSKAIIEASQHCITIPKRGGAESLNAGVSAGILCAILTQP